MADQTFLFASKNKPFVVNGLEHIKRQLADGGVSGQLPTGRRNIDLGENPSLASSVYNGYFKVITTRVEPGQPESDDNPKIFKVVDGAAPTSDIAGITDIGNLAPTELAFLETGMVYLVATYSGASYVLEIDSSLPSSGNYGYVLLATVSGGVVTQRWTDNVVYFSERYFV